MANRTPAIPAADLVLPPLLDEVRHDTSRGCLGLRGSHRRDRAGSAPKLIWSSFCLILTVGEGRVSSLPCVIPEIDIWRAAILMQKHFGDDAELESARRADELWESGDMAGAAVWRRIIDSVRQLANTTPPGAIH